jgi:hypothetical protein
MSEIPEPHAQITISREEYQRLRDRDRKLSQLEADGVDNWEGYRALDEDDEDA